MITHTMPEHLSDLAICSRCAMARREARRSAASVTLLLLWGGVDWERHKDNCIPVMLTETTGKGQGLVASRDIEIGQVTGALPVRYPAFPHPRDKSQASPVDLTVSRAVVAPAMAIPNFSQTMLTFDAGRGSVTG